MHTNPLPDHCDVGAVVRALQCLAVPIVRLLEVGELVPAAPGFYCWWSHRGAIAGLPHVPHPLDRRLSLLYVGISPARETSRQTVRSRVIGNHLNGNVGSSTFRFVAALLIDALELDPYLRGTKVALSADDNARLSAWQREHLLLTSCARERPWAIEGEVIAQLEPPLDSAANARHAFYPVVRAAQRSSADERVPLRPHLQRIEPSGDQRSRGRKAGVGRAATVGERKQLPRGGLRYEPARDGARLHAADRGRRPGAAAIPREPLE